MSGERIASNEDKARGARMQALREAGGFRRQLDLAAVSGVLKNDVSRIESGTNKFNSETTRRAYAEAFGVPVESLLAYADGNLSLADLRKVWAPKLAPEVPDDSALKALQLDQDPLPNRAAAIELLAPTYPPEVLTSLRRMSFKGGDDLEVEDFVNRARELRKLFDELEGEGERKGDAAQAATSQSEPKPTTFPTAAELKEAAAKLPPRKRRAPAER